MSTDIDEQLIGQLVLTEDSVASSIGTILGSVAAADHMEEFKGALDRYIDQRQAEIDELCRTNYSSFFTCIQWHQTFKLEMASLIGRVQVLKQQIATSGEVLLAKKIERLDLLQVQHNLNGCYEACESSLRAFSLAQMASLHILDRKFEDALRQLDSLSRQIRLIDNFSYSQQLSIQVMCHTDHAVCRIVDSNANFQDSLSCRCRTSILAALIERQD